MGCSTKDLIDEMGVCKRTILRDMSVLRKAGIPISTYQNEHDANRTWWRIDRSFSVNQQLILNPTEILSFMLTQKFLAPLTGTLLGEAITSAMQKIKVLLPRSVQGHFSELEDQVFVKSVGRPDYSHHRGLIDLLNRAIAEETVLDVHYRPTPPQAEIRSEFHPYGLVLYGTNLYLVGYVASRGGLRVFKVSRIAAATPRDKRFSRPLDFSLEEYLDKGFGIFASTGRRMPVGVSFTGWAATNVREQQWHHTQKIVHDDGHEVVAEFFLGDMREFKRWVLGFGRCAEVLSPDSLREEIRTEISEMSQAYACPRVSPSP